MVEKIFIDTNIFTGYLILSGIEERKPESERKDLWKRYKKIKPCYDFINRRFHRTLYEKTLIPIH